MADQGAVAFLHDATDELLRQATEELAGLIARQNLKVTCLKWGSGRMLLGKVTMLEGFYSHPRDLYEATKANIGGQTRAYSAVGVDDPDDPEFMYFGLALYGPDVVHFVTATDRKTRKTGTLVIEPASPLNFYSLLKAVRREIEVGGVVSGPDPRSEAAAAQTGCSAAVLIACGAAVSGALYAGHTLAGLLL